MVIARRITDKEGYREEVVAKIAYTDDVDKGKLEDKLNKAIAEISGKDDAE